MKLVNAVVTEIAVLSVLALWAVAMLVLLTCEKLLRKLEPIPSSETHTSKDQ